MARPPVRFPRAIAITLCGATLTAGVLAGGPAASAQSPRSTVKAQIAAAQQRLRALNNQAEIASEHYNAARIKLASAQQAAQKAQTRLTTAQATLTRTQ